MDWSYISTESDKNVFLHSIDKKTFFKIRKKIIRWVDIYNSNGIIPYLVLKLFNNKESLIYKSLYFTYSNTKKLFSRSFST